MRLRTLLALAASAVLLTSCGSSDGPSGREGSPATTEDLDNTTYTSAEVTGYDLVKESQIVLTFKDGSLGVNGGCNTMSAKYEVSDGTLKWTGPAASTMMACSDELAAQDKWLTQQFTDGVEADLNNTTLVLTTSDDAEIVLEAD